MPDIAPKMGRPPLGVRATTIRLSVAAMNRIERLVGPNKLASFIRQAVEEKLARMEREAE